LEKWDQKIIYKNQSFVAVKVRPNDGIFLSPLQAAPWRTTLIMYTCWQKTPFPVYSHLAAGHTWRKMSIQNWRRRSRVLPSILYSRYCIPYITYS
jgi:hypothetical protein